MTALLDQFIPRPDVRKRHETTVQAPAWLVYEVACNFDMQSIPIVRALFWLRARMLGSIPGGARQSQGIVAETLQLGWGRLAEEPGRFFIAGATCQPWQADVTFSPLAPEQCAAYGEPDRVKIVWTLEAEALGPELARFASETRAVATDDRARARFRRYWRTFGIGILMIRWLLLPAVRHQAEQRWRERLPGLSSSQSRPTDTTE
jgi:hypothetical protein